MVVLAYLKRSSLCGQSEDFMTSLPIYEDVLTKSKYNGIVFLFSGGFYSDNVGYVETSCKKCPNGSFVHFDKTPGTQVQDCKSCPGGEYCPLVPVFENQSFLLEYAFRLHY